MAISVSEFHRQMDRLQTHFGSWSYKIDDRRLIFSRVNELEIKWLTKMVDKLILENLSKPNWQEMIQHEKTRIRNEKESSLRKAEAIQWSQIQSNEGLEKVVRSIGATSLQDAIERRLWLQLEE